MMTVVEFIEEIGKRFSKNHEKSLMNTLNSVLSKKGWNIVAIIFLIPLFIFLCIGYLPFLLTLIGISLGIAFLLNGLLTILFQDKLNYDYERGKFYIEWILAILVTLCSLPLFIYLLTIPYE
ncbi:MAG: hypothetical protein J1F16_07860 [Muribaculaceae bacterium]|nr:hypothetical protein [Muribaculaceae bacterium]